MRRLLLIPALLLCALSLSGDTKPAHQYEPAFRASHTISMRTINTGGSCSASAIGPHALLTATHCEAPTDEIEVDGNLRHVTRGVRDGLDHTILYVDGPEFKDTSEIYIGPLNLGDEIYYFGNPGGIGLTFRFGHIAKFAMPNPLARLLGDRAAQVPAVLFDVNGFFGDSGAGIYRDGKIIAVVSFGRGISAEGFSFKLMGAYPFGFTDQQFAEARK